MHWIWTKTIRLISWNVGINPCCGTSLPREMDVILNVLAVSADSSLCASVLFYPFRRPRGVISTPVIRTFGRGGRYYGRGYKNQGVIQVIRSSGRWRTPRARSRGLVLRCLGLDGECWGVSVAVECASNTVVARGVTPQPSWAAVVIGAEEYGLLVTAARGMFQGCQWRLCSKTLFR